ncbi:hypothetical protein GGTG_10995 [Gaeumannomyces tritici R3-111a-1]|uniref:Uncharacterized protein n=1 Tax=Gaeumannomyces tritici (strain R3-111a-1) TaxID=644352 RepID=J3PBX1_GAET3|nr:hypothetical protein GGTG_10995 [Gaeumannomyces tritici R3-111a-1]EJT71741.1 hypothetical protein GGTG_10995 [Gaeumannomyces tritici R3-111a-1]
MISPALPCHVTPRAPLSFRLRERRRHSRSFSHICLPMSHLVSSTPRLPLMQFTATALLALFAVTGAPAMAAPTPFEGIAVPKPNPAPKGTNPIKAAAKKVGEGAAVCVLGAILCGKMAVDAIKGNSPKIYGREDVHTIGNLEARSPDADVPYVAIVTRDTAIDEESQEEAPESFDEEAEE